MQALRLNQSASPLQLESRFLSRLYPRKSWRPTCRSCSSKSFRIRISAIDLPRSLILDIHDVRKLDQGRTQFDVSMSLDAHLDATQQNWAKGIKLYDGSLRARFRVKMALRCQVATRIESEGTLVPDLIFRLRVTQADINYDHFVTEHIAGLGGDAARLLGDALQKALRPWLQGRVLPKADSAIVKAADTKEVRLRLASILK